ncbi:MAG: dihydrofolate reductase [Polyangiaceae bacterium]|nr:dihydrofolate reductase [Polyangiaceae bacterium]
MRRLTSFQFISVDGYYADQQGDTSWHPHDDEGAAYAAEMLASSHTLVFGRVTYEFMASFWPTPMAAEVMPAVAKGMNQADKIVFSRTLKKADWRGATVVSDDAVDAMKRLKQTSGKDLTLLGSGSLLRQFAEHRLIDELQLMVDPLILGRGRSVFEGVSHRLDLKRVKTRNFDNGCVLIVYRPA